MFKDCRFGEEKHSFFFFGHCESYLHTRCQDHLLPWSHHLLLLRREHQRLHHLIFIFSFRLKPDCCAIRNGKSNKVCMHFSSSFFSPLFRHWIYVFLCQTCLAFDLIVALSSVDKIFAAAGLLKPIRSRISKHIHVDEFDIWDRVQQIGLPKERGERFGVPRGLPWGHHCRNCRTGDLYQPVRRDYLCRLRHRGYHLRNLP